MYIYQGVEGLQLEEPGEGLAGEEEEGHHEQVEGGHPPQHGHAGDVEAVGGQQRLAHIVQTAVGAMTKYLHVMGVKPSTFMGKSKDN